MASFLESCLSVHYGMNRLLVGFAAVFCLSGLAMAKTWGTATSKDATGRTVIFRFVDTFDAGFNRSEQPVRIILAWKYQGTNGMPLPAERERMDAMEDLLLPVVERDDFSTLALVSTGDNLREWIYYARSEEGFLERLNQALGGQEPFPIKIHVTSDPAWANYQEFIDGLQR